MKPIWKSKTVAIMAIIVAAAPYLNEFIPAEWTTRLVALAGIALRLLSYEKVSVK